MISHYIYVIFFTSTLLVKAVAHTRSAKKMLIEISQNSQESTCARVSFLIKLKASGLWHRCFSVNFEKFLRTPFFTEHLWWLGLYLFVTHPCIFYIFHQVVWKPFKFISSGLETNHSLVNETNLVSFLPLFVYSFSTIAWQSVQTVSV